MGQLFIHRLTGLSIEVVADVGGGFVSRVRELPGCVSQGETERDALEGLEEALMVMLEILHEDDPQGYERLVSVRSVSSRQPGIQEVNSTAGGTDSVAS